MHHSLETAAMRSNLIAFGLLAVVGLTAAVEVNDINQVDAAKATGRITLKDLEVPAGTTLNLEKLKPGTVVEFAGRISFGYEEWEGPLIKATGKNIKIVGLPGNLIDLQGERWWDHKGGNYGKKKPKFFSLKLQNSSVTGLNVKNLPVHGFSIYRCKNLEISQITIDTKQGDVDGGHNTDGFDVGNSDGVKIFNCTVWNQDDCLAVNSGTNIEFTDNFCSGGHGLSIGSVGGRSNNVVRQVLVKNCIVQDSDNGIRVKTIKDAIGSVANVTFENIVLKNILKKGIVVQGNYLNGGPTGEPTGGVPITGLTLKNVRGDVSPRGTNIYVLVANASEWTCSDVNVTGGKKESSRIGLPDGCEI